MPVTLADIAERVGVTKTTVSRVLNGTGNFRDETRQKVMATAKAMGYRPNPISSALAGARSMTLGILVNSLDPTIATAIQQVENRASNRGYASIVACTGHVSDQADLETVENLIRRRVDGLLIDNTEPLCDDVKTCLQQAEPPVVYLRWAPPQANHAVLIDQKQALRELSEHLLALGHRQAMLIRLTSAVGVSDVCWQSLREDMAEHGFELIDHPRWRVRAEAQASQTIVSAYYASAVYDVVRSGLEAGERPTAFIFPDDEWAMAAMAAIRDAGLRVPEDISVVGFDDHPLARYAQPALTTIAVPMKDIFLTGVDMLFQAINNTPPPAAPRYLHSQFIPRHSTGPCKD